MPSATATPPPDVTMPALNATKGIQLKFWIDEANRAAGKKSLMKGTVEALRMKLAEYYGLDLAATPEKPVGPITRGHDMQKRQFAYLCEFWNEWMGCVVTSQPFLLCSTSAESLDVRLLELAITSIPTQISFALPNPLPTSPPLPAVTNDSVYALSHLARSGDCDAFITLLRFRAVVQARADPIIRLGISCSSSTPPQLPLPALDLSPSLSSLPSLPDVQPAVGLPPPASRQ